MLTHNKLPGSIREDGAPAVWDLLTFGTGLEWNEDNMWAVLWIWTDAAMRNIADERKREQAYMPPLTLDIYRAFTGQGSINSWENYYGAAIRFGADIKIDAYASGVELEDLDVDSRVKIRWERVIPFNNAAWYWREFVWTGEATTAEPTWTTLWKTVDKYRFAEPEPMFAVHNMPLTRDLPQTLALGA